MTNCVVLNNIDHMDLKVDTRYSEELGDGLNHVLIAPTEIADVQREYPILFRKNSRTEKYEPLALLGFEKGENLFLDGVGGWNASYVPGILARGPFLIGFQEQKLDGETRKEPVIHVDLDSPRVNSAEGAPVFLEHGGNTPYLENIARILNGIAEGLAINDAMFAAFDAFGLIEPVNISVSVSEGQEYKLNGYYTVSEKKLAELNGEALEKLHKAGFLQGAFLVIASLANINKLIELKRKRALGSGHR